MPAARYEVLEQIAAGDFATVFRGRDHELGRDVAIKQIHAQYLADPRQLDRFWHEAQLLASLQHPHVMTIYDLVRERGWLILELMHGSLTQLLGGRPIDLKDLRLTLNYTLHALQTMHRHGILHGDLKPSNLLVDRNQRVKLGDFGIARRLAGEGSVVKGTTKYIAPEVLSDQFGPVGPHSDVYSLGFTAYELMCGEHFDSLFPGLSMFGRDRQIAWMMWHSAADRRLPEIARVLNGVPPDLAYIIQKMTEKDPAKRYRTIDEVLADLKLDGAPPPGPNPADLERESALARAAQRKRALTIAAATGSIVLSLGMLFLPTGNRQKATPKQAPAQPTSGEIAEVDHERSRIFVKPRQGDPLPITFRDGVDHILLNGDRATLAQLDRADRISISKVSRDGKEFQLIEATRAAAEESAGSVVSIDLANRVLAVEVGSDITKFAVGEHVPIEINGETKSVAGSFRLKDLQALDRVTVRFKSGADQRRDAGLVRATRKLSAKGFVVEVSGKELKFRVGESWQSASEERTLPLAASIAVTLNGQTTEEGRVLGATDLRLRDAVQLDYDTAIHQIAAFRETESRGRITAIDADRRTISVDGGDGDSTIWLVNASTQIDIPGSSAPGDFGVFRVGDPVVVRRSSTNFENRNAAAISVTPRADPRTWVFLLEQADYDNPRLPKLPFIEQDANALQTTLRFLARVPESQFLRERNATRLRIETVLPEFVSRVPANAQLVVYCLGLGYLDGSTGYFAPHGFDDRRADATGVPVRWLIDQIEKCAAEKKVLVLDTSRDSGAPQIGAFVSAAELAQAARPAPRRPLSASVTVFASSGVGELGVVVQDQQRGLFSLAAATAFSGKADTNGDHHVAVDELVAFVTQEVARLRGTTTPAQTPVAFPPDASPPRLSDEAQQAVHRLFAHFARTTPDAAHGNFSEAEKLCAGQPDAHLVYALLLMKHEKSPLATQTLEQVRLGHPNAAPAHEMAAWLSFRRGDLKAGLSQLKALIEHLPRGSDSFEQAYASHAAAMAGKMVGFARYLAAQERRLTNADLAELATSLKQTPDAIQTTFRESFRAMERLPTELEQRIAEATTPAEKSRLEAQRGNFSQLVPFDFELLKQHLRDGLER